jgi:hypothetical protein
MVELRTRKPEITGDGGTHREKRGFIRILYVTQFIIPQTEETRLDQPCKYTHTKYSLPNLSNSTPDFSYLLVSSTSFTSSYPIFHFPLHNQHIITEHKVKSSDSIPPCNEHKLTQCTSFTEYSIHRKYCIHPANHPQRLFEFSSFS